jgi:hypothetical protein
MGNRAIVVFTDGKDVSAQVYLHWNGGPESIYAFLEECDRRKIRGTSDLSYCAARFCHVVGDFFDQDKTTSTSLGLFSSPKTLAQYKRTEVKNNPADDNGIFLVSGEPGEWTVERYHCDRWWDVSEVSQEKTTALQEERYHAIKRRFRELRPNIGPY